MTGTVAGRVRQASPEAPGPRRAGRTLPAPTAPAGEAVLAALQRSAGNAAVAHGVQRMPHPDGRRCPCGGIAGPDGECAACRARRLAGLSVQRAPLAGAPSRPEVHAATWLVEDGTTELAPGQMPKSLWLNELKAALCARADEELKPSGRSAQGCPVLAFYIGYFSGRSASEIGAAVLRYAPETAGVTSAREAITPIVERVGAAVGVWVATGRITGIPEGGSKAAAPAGGEGEVGVQRKGRGANGGGTGGGDPGAILGHLGEGRPLEGGVRSRMEPLFGRDLSGVRVHEGTTAASLSAGLNARAFTVGNHIALGAGEYQPGTIHGDALLAHELAHVVQQSGASPTAAPLRDGSPAYAALEEEADATAFGAVASLWGRVRAVSAGLGRPVMPRLRTGVGVQRCRAKRCPSGKSWQVVGEPAGLGSAGCLCTWRCLPVGTSPCGGRYAGPTSEEAQLKQGPPPRSVPVPHDYVKRGVGEVTKVRFGAHVAGWCGCFPLDIEGEQEGATRCAAPMVPTGADVTDFMPGRVGRAFRQLEGPSGTWGSEQPLETVGRKAPITVTPRRPAKAAPAPPTSVAPPKPAETAPAAPAATPTSPPVTKLPWELETSQAPVAKPPATTTPTAPPAPAEAAPAPPTSAAPPKPAETAPAAPAATTTSPPVTKLPWELETSQAPVAKPPATTTPAEAPPAAKAPEPPAPPAPQPAAAPPPRTGDPVVDFQARYSKVDPSPSSMSALSELFRRTSSGQRTKTKRPGRYVPVLTRGAAAELKVIVNLAVRPEVAKIELIPSSSAGRTPDIVIHVKQSDGSIVKYRFEITAATGAARGYQLTGHGGSRPTGVEQIVAAVRRKAASTPTKPSQLVSELPGVPTGGTLAIQLPRSTEAQGPADVALSMALLAPELANQPHVQAIEFSVPRPKGQGPLRYTRNPDGTYTLQPPPAP